MPTYEYECEQCGHKFDFFQNMSDKPLTVCPECGGAVKRLIGAGSGIIFKGSGFHALDHRVRTRSTTCGKDAPCCGREIPCDKKPCDD
jgi:putative FmdB family regulatory protein